MSSASSSSYLYSAFIGNLRSDISRLELQSKLQLLFETVGVTVPADEIQTRIKDWRPSFAFVLFQDKSTFDFVAKKLNDAPNDEVVFPGKQLIVSPARKQNQERHSSSNPFPKHVRKNSKRKTHSNEKNIKLPSVAIGTGPFDEHTGNTHSHGSSIVRSSFLPSLEINPTNMESLMSQEKCFYFGQKLGTEDRVTEYKQGGAIFGNLRAYVEKYVCAFLNSEGGNLLFGVKDDCTVCGVEISSSKKEDILRLKLDKIMKGFKPAVFPNLYSITFIPVYVLPPKHASSQERDVISNCISASQSSATLPLMPEPLLNKPLKIRSGEGVSNKNVFTNQPPFNLSSVPPCPGDYPPLKISPVEENTSSNIDLLPTSSLKCPNQNNGVSLVLNAKETVLKVIKISVHPPPRQVSGQDTLYQNTKQEVYIRRDGSVQGPLQTSEILEWCRCNITESLNMEHSYLKQQADRKQEEISMNMKLIDELAKQNNFLQNQCKEQENLLTSEIDRLKNREREMENKLGNIRTKSKICVIC